MKKALLFAIFTILMFATPAFGQHHGGSGGGSHAAPFHPEGHGTQPSHGDHFPGNSGHVTAQRDRYHYDGRHFDHFYHNRFFGRDHVFFVHPVFYGGGYRFWYGGFWFNWLEPWPAGWCYCDNVYIDYDAGDDCYFLYNPVHPGFRLRIGVVF